MIKWKKLLENWVKVIQIESKLEGEKYPNIIN